MGWVVDAGHHGANVCRRMHFNKLFGELEFVTDLHDNDDPDINVSVLGDGGQKVEKKKKSRIAHHPFFELFSTLFQT